MMTIFAFLIGIVIGAGTWEIAGRYMHYGSIGKDLLTWIRSWE